jgi:hypothetical protein
MAYGTVIQGNFPRGLPRFGAVQVAAASPQWVQDAISRSRTSPLVQRAVSVPRNAAPQPPANAVQVPPSVMTFDGGAGQPLAPAVRQRMERLFATSFADVRVHVGRAAATLGALAFTRGANIHFAPGRYDPATPQGLRLLGHELAHVVQQKTGRVRNPFGSGIAVVHDRMLEAEAERMASRVAEPTRVPPLPVRRVVQPAWVRKNGKVEWQERKLNEGKYRITGDEKWYSWWKPVDLNTLMQVYEEIPKAADANHLPDDTEDLHLMRASLDGHDIAKIGSMPSLRKIELTNCTFNVNFNTGDWSHLTKLEYLSIYSPNTFVTADDMQGLTALPALKTLRFVRCDFVNTTAGYQALGQMSRLTHLDLARTITSEKAVGISVQEKVRRVTNLDAEIIKSLKKLIRGSLRYLDIRWCTAFSDGQVQGLLDEGLAHGCQVNTDRNIEASPDAQFADLLSRIR